MAGLVKNKVLWYISNWFLFLLPLPEAQEIFLWYLLWKSCWALGDRSHNIVPLPTHDWVPLEFLTPRVVHAELPAFRQLYFRFSYPSTRSPGGFHSWGWPLSRWLLVITWLSLQSWGSLPGVLMGLMDPRRVVDFFSLLRFLLVVRTEQWLWSSLYVEPENRSSLSKCFLLLLMTISWKSCIWHP